MSALIGAYKMTRRVDKRIGLWVTGAFLLPIVLAVLIGLLIYTAVFGVILKVM